MGYHSIGKWCNTITHKSLWLKAVKFDSKIIVTLDFGGSDFSYFIVGVNKVNKKCVSFDFCQQTLMGIFYYARSVALIEDLPLNHTYTDPKAFFNHADKAYEQVRPLWKYRFVLVETKQNHFSSFSISNIDAQFCSILHFQNALNCWIAACIYVLTLVVSAQQFYANNRAAA